MSESEELGEIRQFAARLSGDALQECLQELASWSSNEADYDVLISGSILMFNALPETQDEVPNLAGQR